MSSRRGTRSTTWPRRATRSRSTRVATSISSGSRCGRPFSAAPSTNWASGRSFPGRGDYKTARFMYTERDFTPESREMIEWLVGSLFDQLVEGVAQGRGMETGRGP